MAFYTSVVNNLNSRVSYLCDEVEKLRAKNCEPVANVATRSVSFQDDTNAKIEELDKRINTSVEAAKAELKALIKSERAAIEAALFLRLEAHVNKAVKDRIEMSTHTMKTQIMTDVQLMVEEVKEQVVAAAATHSVSSITVKEDQSSNDVIPPVVSDAPSAATTLSPTSLVDIEMLTKEILSDASAHISSACSDDFAFNTKKKEKVLRKK